MNHTILEAALRRAAFWARRGIPRTAAELLSGTDGVLHYRPEHCGPSQRHSRAARRCASS